MTCSNSGNLYSVNTANNRGCPDQFGCLPGVCPDFVIRRHDSKPAFKVKIEDCDGPMDLTGLILEASMWAKGKLKKSITATDTSFALADNIGYNQIMVGDIIILDRVRRPEYMLVTAFDENNRLVQVQRGYHGTIAQSWKKGDSLRIMKFIDATAETEMLYQDILELDGTTTSDVLIDSFFVYEWNQNDTCLPGCYYLEFKLIKMVMAALNSESSISALSIGGDIPSVIPSFTDPGFTPSDFHCGVPNGIEWIRRFPVEGEGFLIKITDSPTSER